MALLLACVNVNVCSLFLAPRVSVVETGELRQAAIYLCGIFVDEGLINREPAGNLERHIVETQSEFEKQLEAANLLKDDFRVQNLKVCLPEDNGSSWVGFGQVVTDNSTPRRPVIQNLCVTRRYRRRGVGRALVQQAMATARDHWQQRELYLNVEEDNETAICFYRSLGFRKVIDSAENEGFGSFMMRRDL